jgi:hypothetical protein
MNDLVYKTITQDNINLTYIGYPFIKVINKESSRRLWIYQSLDTLENIIEFEIPPSEENIWLIKFEEAGYCPTDWNDTIHGYRGRTNGKYYDYEFRLGKGSKNTIVRVRNQDEIDDFIETRRVQLNKQVNWYIDSAKMAESKSHYLNAINILSDAKDIYEPRKADIMQRLTELKERAMEHYFTLLKTTNLQDSALSLKYCDTLDIVSPNNITVFQIRNNIKSVKPYSKANYIAYKKVTDGLSLIVEEGIFISKKINKRYPITLEFTFLTDSINKSFGEILFNTPETLSKKKLREFSYYNKLFKTKMDSICQLPDIRPIESNGINLRTKETLNATITWNTTETTIIDSCTKGLMEQTEFIPHVQYIESLYFTKRTRQYVNKQIVTQSQKRQPTKRIYTFCKTEKNCNGNKYIDIDLTDFDTPGYFSWMPSLIIPGWGTYLQEKRSTVIARALPFFLFGSLSAAGFIWENGKGKEIRRPTINEGHVNYPWEYKNFGYIVGCVGGAISATIYLTDIIEGIQTGARNMRYSKELRNKIKKDGSVHIKIETIDLQQATK